jgi:hypothetical protein
MVQNPEPTPADLKFTFMLPGGQTVERTTQAGPSSRLTIRLNDVPGLEGAEVSTLVECTSGNGIVAERSSYFDYYGCNGGNNAPGVTDFSNQWYLAEGYTGQGFDTYILLQNPNNEPSTVGAVYMREDGKNVEQTYTVKPHSRYSIKANNIPGLENTGFSTFLVSRNSVGFIAERAMYFFNYNGRSINDGTDSVGVTAPCLNWYFAEGYTGQNCDTWILIQNPSAETAEVRVTFNMPGGGSVQKEYDIKPRSRHTIKVNSVDGLSNAEVATTIQSTNGVKVVAERAMYFIYSNGYGNRDGGHNTVGVTGPSTSWYFAEGYTGL